MYQVIWKYHLPEKWDNWFNRPISWSWCGLCVVFHLSWIALVAFKLATGQHFEIEDFIKPFAITGAVIWMLGE